MRRDVASTVDGLSGPASGCLLILIHLPLATILTAPAFFAGLVAAGVGAHMLWVGDPSLSALMQAAVATELALGAAAFSMASIIGRREKKDRFALLFSAVLATFGAMAILASAVFRFAWLRYEKAPFWEHVDEQAKGIFGVVDLAVSLAIYEVGVALGLVALVTTITSMWNWVVLKE